MNKKGKGKRRKTKLRSKKNHLLYNIGWMLNNIDKRLIEIRDKDTKNRPNLAIKTFDFKQIDDKDLFSFHIKGDLGFEAHGTMSFWNCIMVFESFRCWKPDKKEEE